MLLEWLSLAPLPPLMAALFIGTGVMAGWLKGEASEATTKRLALYPAGLALIMVLALILLRSAGLIPEQVNLGSWMKSGSYRIGIDFTLDPPALSYAALSSLMGLLVLRFSVNYMHREEGFHRFFFILSLFISAMLWIGLSGNAVLTFAGWELAGVCSYLLISYNLDRPTAAANATRAFVTNRIGDAGFTSGIALGFMWASAIDWPSLVNQSSHLEEWQAGVLASCFALAAIAKSAQFPLSPWLARAMEGPTPSSAIFYGSIMIHAGVFLVIRLHPLFDQAPVARDVLVFIGSISAMYGFLAGLAQTDVKSALAFSTTGQVGLMFLWSGLGLWNLALIHLCSHAIFRGYQFLSAPSFMHWVKDLPARPVHPLLRRQAWLYTAVLQRFWLEPIGDRLVTRPALGLAYDLHNFDRKIIEPAFGEATPPISPLASAAKNRPQLAQETLRVSGIFGGLLKSTANLLHWFEEKLVLQSVGHNLFALGRRIGKGLNYFESLLNQPRYLVLIVLASLLATF